MRPPVQLRENYDAPDLRALAKASRDANQIRRLLALAAIYDGGHDKSCAQLYGTEERIGNLSSGYRTFRGIRL